MQALIMKAETVGSITPRQKRYLFQQISARGWKKQEPWSDSVPLERPRAILQLAEQFFGTPVDVGRMASAVALPEDLVESYLEVQASRSGASPMNVPRPAGTVVPIRGRSGVSYRR